MAEITLQEALHRVRSGLDEMEKQRNASDAHVKGRLAEAQKLEADIASRKKDLEALDKKLADSRHYVESEIARLRGLLNQVR